MTASLAPVRPGFCAGVTSKGRRCTVKLAEGSVGTCGRCQGDPSPAAAATAVTVPPVTPGRALKAGKGDAEDRGAAARARAKEEKRKVAAAFTGRLVDPSEVAQCEGQVRSFAAKAADGDLVQCKRAVVAPETLCYRHGGSNKVSFGDKSFAKASAEAERGEARVAGAEYWTVSSDVQQAFVESELADLLKTDAAHLVGMTVAMQSFDMVHGIKRFSKHNRTVFAMSLRPIGFMRGLEGEDLVDFYFERLGEAHHTKAGWAALGRVVRDDAVPGYVFNNGLTSVMTKRKGETDQEFVKRAMLEVLKDNPGLTQDEAVAAAWELLSRKKPTRNVYDQYSIKDTDLTPEEAAKNPEDRLMPPRPKSSLEQPLPPAPGDTAAQSAALDAFLATQGISVRTVSALPDGASANYVPSSRVVRVIPTGSPEADLAKKLHEAGHALLGHSGHSHGESDGAQEVEAELFAAVGMKWFGADSPESSERSAHYVQGWAQRVQSPFLLKQATANVNDAFDRLVAGMATNAPKQDGPSGPSGPDAPEAA